MTEPLNSLRNYRDHRGNVIVSPKELSRNIHVLFRGANNRITIDSNARIERLSVTFDGNHGELVIGASTSVGGGMWNIRVGEDSRVSIGDNVSTTSVVVVSAVEGTKVTIGSNSMLASGVQLRADDGHAIYEVQSKKRVNHSKDIEIGSYVWLAYGVMVLGGTSIGSGSVIGLGSIVKASLPNNVVAVGNPARIVKRDIAWERPHLSLTSPPYRPDATVISPSGYWKLTERELKPPGLLRRLFRRFVPLKIRVKLRGWLTR